jgi:hypothetical protein
MAVSIPANDVQNTLIATQITQLGTLITANLATAAPLTQLQQQLQWQLVQNLMNAAIGQQGGGTGGGMGSGGAVSRLNPATILSTCTVNT